MSKVYIVNNMSHDYGIAKKYGEIVFMTDGKVTIFKTDIVIKLIKESLVDFKADDFLLISGPAFLSIISVVILLNRFDVIKFLVFDAKERNYVVRHIHKSIC